MNHDKTNSNRRLSPGANPAFGVYLHVPFCVHRCSYCDFFTFTDYQKSDFSRVSDAIEREMKTAAEWLESQQREVPPARSVFFGGGTPSLLPTSVLGQLLSSLSMYFAFERDIEITLEANPETVSEAFAKELRERTPINRLSLGAQSFQSKYLKALERLGSAESTRTAVKRLRSVGFERLSLDLIFGIPGQTKADILADIDEVMRLDPGHVSFYSLTLKPGHPLFKDLPDEDVSADLYEAGIEHLAKAGYAQYEISNFARPGLESRHNLLYWDGGDFLGFGPSAASRLYWEGRFRHRKALSNYEKYLATPRFEDTAFTDTTWGQTVLEATFLELRCNAGVELSAFRERYGYDLTRAKKFELFRKGGLVEREGDRLKLTARGRLLADSVTRDLVDVSPEAERPPA